MMITIATHGIAYIEPLDGSCEWYWGSDYTHGDLYEAEEAYHGHHPVNCNRLVFSYKDKKYETVPYNPHLFHAVNTSGSLCHGFFVWSRADNCWKCSEWRIDRAWTGKLEASEKSFFRRAVLLAGSMI